LTAQEENPMKLPNTLLTPREAAAAIGVSYPTIKQWILAGKLRTIKTPGGHHRIPQAELKRYLPTPAKPSSTASRERFRQVSGRNQIIGTVIEVRISGLLAKVVLQLGGQPDDSPRAPQRITAIITADAVREMQIRKGQTAVALMKSTEVMITRV
jgi:molybdopterin-binding protein